MALLVALGVASGAAGFGYSASRADATPASTPGAVSDPVSAFGACLASGGSGDLLLLIDESGSLKTTDPQLARVAAVKYLVHELASFVGNTGANLDIKFSVFGDSYTDLSGWTTLNSGSEAGLSAVADTLGVHNRGFDTDYWLALENARRDLAERKAARLDGQSCQAIAWFTDGQLDFDPRDTKKERSAYGDSKQFAPDIRLDTEAAAQQLAGIAANLICEPSGLADQLRSSGVVTFVVGLDASSPDFSLVESIATGSSTSGNACGAITEPTPGTFTRASDIDALLFAFDALGSPGQKPLQTEAGICQVDTCTEEAHRFVLDASTPAVHILASAEVGGLSVSLIAPTGDIIALEPKAVGLLSTATSTAGNVSYAWQSGKTVSVDLSEVDPAGWSGLWQLVFVDPAGLTGDKRSFSNIRIASDFRPAVVSQPLTDLHRDDVVDVQLGITGADGAVIDPAALQGTVQVSATLVAADGASIAVATNLGKEDLAGSVPLDLAGVAVGTATLSLELVHTTAAAMSNGQVIAPGTTLEPQTVEVRIPVGPPLNFPSATATRVDFGVLDGSTTSTSEVAFAGNGCVWLDPSSVAVKAGPAEAGTVLVSTPKASSALTCVSSSQPLPLEFSVEDSANGTVNGSFDVLLSPDGELDRALPTTIEFTADLRKPFNATSYTLGLVLALLLGVGIPVGLVYFGQYMVARIPARALLSQRIAVSVADGTVLRDGAAFAIRPSDFTEMTGIPPGGARSLAVAGVSLSAKVSATPGGSGYVVVEAPGFVSASDGVPAWSGKTPSARLPLAIHNHWIVLHDPSALDSVAEVILLVSGDADADRKQSLAESLTSRLPELLERLVALAGAAPVGGDSDGGWGSGGADSAPRGFDLDSAPSAPSNPSASGFDLPERPGTEPGATSGFGFSD